VAGTGGAMSGEIEHQRLTAPNDLSNEGGEREHHVRRPSTQAGL